jgi:hypothetical protein
VTNFITWCCIKYSDNIHRPAIQVNGTVALIIFSKSKQCDLIEAINESKVVVQRLRDERNDPSSWDVVCDKTVEIASEFEIAPCTPRRIGRQIHREDYQWEARVSYRVVGFTSDMFHLVFHQPIPSLNWMREPKSLLYYCLGFFHLTVDMVVRALKILNILQ